MLEKRKRQRIDRVMYLIGLAFVFFLIFVRCALEFVDGQDYCFKYHDELKQVEPVEAVITYISPPEYKWHSDSWVEYTHDGEIYGGAVLRAAGDQIGKTIEVKFLKEEKRYVRSSFVISYNFYMHIKIFIFMCIIIIFGRLHYRWKIRME